MTRPLDASTLLRNALRLDAIASGGLGLLLTLAAGTLAPLLGLPEPLLRGAGILLVPYALVIAAMGARAVVPRGAATAVVALTVVWVLASALLLVGTSVSPTALGHAFVIAQAIVVGAFAEAQWIGLRRSSGSTAVAGRAA
jgi:hypothetical protein